ncbi:RNA polymerase sigma factor [Maritalea sp.]|uniref:RNA polymerase sigma factor n=1 Tax=Maritalea sp. TaxID=2003361 RepID=UPI0039E21D63
MNEGEISGKSEHRAVEALFVNRPAFMGVLIKQLGNMGEAEDVFQEFCLRVVRRKHQLRDAEKLNAWLYTILRSAMNDHFRKNGRNNRLAAAYEREQESTVGHQVGADEFLYICQCVKRLVPSLQPGQSELIRRIDLQDENRQVVASDLGISLGTLGVRLYRARASLRDRLLEHCGCCCEHGFEDCACPPTGCEEQDSSTKC